MLMCMHCTGQGVFGKLLMLSKKPYEDIAAECFLCCWRVQGPWRVKMGLETSCGASGRGARGDQAGEGGKQGGGGRLTGRTRVLSPNLPVIDGRCEGRALT